jgi:very-short-patch-repair endonuclease
MDSAPVAHRFRSYADLRAAGLSRRQITRELSGGSLVRARNDVYVAVSAPDAMKTASRVGGLVGCVSALALWDVFVQERHGVHAHLRTNGVIRGPDDGVVRHWGRLIRAVHPRSLVVEPLDALRQAVICQSPRAAIASVDSALNKGIVRQDELDELFAAIPARRRVILPHIDGRAEAGTETLVRLMVRALGGHVELQVRIRDVGRVDMIVDGWLVIECDSRAYHSDWQTQLEDRRRDLALAERGYVSIRPAAEDILYRPEVVVEAIAGMLRAGRSGHLGGLTRVRAGNS